MKGRCDGRVQGRWPCSNPAAFLFVNLDTANDGCGTRTEVCGKHLAGEINAFPIPSPTSTQFVVIPYSPNVELLQGISTPPSPEGK